MSVPSSPPNLPLWCPNPVNGSTTHPIAQTGQGGLYHVTGKPSAVPPSPSPSPPPRSCPSLSLWNPSFSARYLRGLDKCQESLFCVFDTLGHEGIPVGENNSVDPVHHLRTDQGLNDQESEP